jgi:hypothetical protein
VSSGGVALAREGTSARRFSIAGIALGAIAVALAIFFIARPDD